MSSDVEKRWEITFTDMLTLLLTFFVFIIAVSSFKTEDYKLFWKSFPLFPKEQPHTKSFKVELIKGIKLPRLPREAEPLLNELEETFAKSSHAGVDVFYTENKISLVVSEELTFTGGRSQLKEEIKPMLAQLIPTMQATPFHVSVEGHSDAQTSEKIDNRLLSLDRALDVARFLVESGLDKQKISVSGYGPHRPIADNGTKEGRLRNRRVEINIIVNND